MNTTVANGYVLGHDHLELNRLVSQGRFFGELTRQVLEAAGLKPGMRVLDLGSGAGDVAFLAASMVGPTGSIIGVDCSTDATARASTRAAEAKLGNVRFVTSDLHAFKPPEPIDAVIGRLVLMYVREPERLLRHLAALLQPGGLIVFHEFDMAACTSEPELPLMALNNSRLTQAFKFAQADVRMGLHLPQIFARAGLPTPETIAHTRIGTGADTEVFQQIAAVTRSMIPAMQRAGVASAAEVDVDTLAVRLQQEAQQHDATLVAPLFVGAWSCV
jgi:ubiquinone/menaquinone biosynthesis C-methylase UbiE